MILAYPHPHRPQPSQTGWWRSREKVATVALVGLAHVALFALAARQLVDRPAPPAATPDIGIQLEAPPLAPVERTPETAPSRPTVSPRPTPAPIAVADPVLTPVPINPTGDLKVPVLPSIDAGPANGTGAGAGTAPDPVVRGPTMPRQPSGDEMARFYPDRAQRMGVQGQALIECTVSLAGKAEACRVLSETPGDYGFGDSTVKLAQRFKLTPKTVDGKPVAGGVIRIPLRWTLD